MNIDKKINKIIKELGLYKDNRDWYDIKKELLKSGYDCLEFEKHEPQINLSIENFVSGVSSEYLYDIDMGAWEIEGIGSSWAEIKGIDNFAYALFDILNSIKNYQYREMEVV